MAFPGYTFNLRGLNEEQARDAFRKVMGLDCFQEYEMTALLVDGKDFLQSDKSLRDILPILPGEMKIAIVGMRPTPELSAKYNYNRAGDILSLAVGIEPQEKSDRYQLSIISVGVPNYEQNLLAQETYDLWKNELDKKVRKTLNDILP